MLASYSRINNIAHVCGDYSIGWALGMHRTYGMWGMIIGQRCLVLKQGRRQQGVGGEWRTGVEVMLHHQRPEAETAGLKMKVEPFETLSSAPPSAQSTWLCFTAVINDQILHKRGRGQHVPAARCEPTTAAHRNSWPVAACPCYCCMEMETCLWEPVIWGFPVVPDNIETSEAKAAPEVHLVSTDPNKTSGWTGPCSLTAPSDQLQFIVMFSLLNMTCTDK